MLDSMKVITGEFKHRNLLVPKNKHHIRMTTGFIKKVIIDILGSEIKGKLILELFAGSGGVGVELLSNLADKVVFVEKNFYHCEIIKKNCQQLGLNESRYYVICNHFKNALAFLRDKYCFDFIFLDPPYKENLVSITLEEISKINLYNKNTIIIAEHHYKEKIEDKTGKFIKIDSRKYGMTVLDFFKAW